MSMEIQLRPMLIHRGYPADASKPEVLTILSPVIVELERIAPCGTSPWYQVRHARMVLGIAASRLHTQRCCTQLSLLCTRSIQGTSSRPPAAAHPGLNPLKPRIDHERDRGIINIGSLLHPDPRNREGKLSMWPEVR